MIKYCQYHFDKFISAHVLFLINCFIKDEKNPAQRRDLVCINSVRCYGVVLMLRRQRDTAGIIKSFDHSTNRLPAP